MATTWTDADPLVFLADVTPAGRRRDAEILLDLMRKVTGCEPRMFGPSIVGFGEYAYEYASGHKGVAPAAAFSPRKASSVVYLNAGFAATQADALLRLGPHTTGSGCLYIKDLTQVDLGVLKRLVETSFKTATAETPGNRARDADVKPARREGVEARKAGSMTLAQVMGKLEAQGDEKVRQRYVRDGAGENVFGVLLGKIRGLAREIGTNHALGLELWGTGNHEARILACMLLDPGALAEKDARALLEPLTNPTLVDELVGRVLVKAPIAPALERRWMSGKAELPRRAGWKLLAGRIAAGTAGDLDVAATLSRIERELPAAPYRVKEGINQCLVSIGLQLPAYTAEAIAIGERLGRWDPRPIPKGCTSSYAPEWIAAALALRRGEKTEARKAMDAASAKKKAAPGK